MGVSLPVSGVRDHRSAFSRQRWPRGSSNYPVGIGSHRPLDRDHGQAASRQWKDRLVSTDLVRSFCWLVNRPGHDGSAR